MRRPGRFRPRTVVGGIVAGVLVVGGGLVFRLATGDDPPTASEAASVPSPANPTATAVSATAPDGSDASAVALPPPTASTGSSVGRGEPGDVELPIDPSNSRTVATRAGARQSGVDYVATVRQRLVYLTDVAGRQVLEAWTAPGADGLVDTELDQAAGIRATLAADGGDVWWVVSPLAVRVDGFGGDRARVSVWLSSLVGSGVDPAVSVTATQPMVRFQIDTVELVWTGERWAVWSITSVDGPTPMTAPSSQIATPDGFITAVEGFEPIREHRP